MRMHPNQASRPAAAAIMATVIGVIMAFAAPHSEASASMRPAEVGALFRGADPAAVEIATQQHVTLAQAETRLSWQQATPALAGALSRQLPAAIFGGIWIDPNDGDRVKVGVVGSDPGARATVARLVSAAGLTGAADIVQVRYSAMQLQDADAWLGTQLGIVARSSTGPIQLDSDYRLDLNRVQLGVAAGQQLTAAERGLIGRAKARYGDLVQVVTESGGTQMTLAACSFPLCSPPLRGGIIIFNTTGNGKVCTGGFIARSRTDGKFYQFTAGHCAAGGFTGTWSTEFPNKSTHAIGPVHHYIYGSAGDMAILAINNPAGWQLPRGWVYVAAGPDTTLNEQYAITSAQYSTQGARICKTGAIGHTSCGVVMALGQNGFADGVEVKNLGEASFCSQEGDSGGPVFAAHQAFGLDVAFLKNNNCVSFYQGIIGAENALNVNLVLSP
jgi:streptogrisin C